MYLVGNKSDLKANRKVSREEAEKMAANFGMPYYETSAFSGENVHESVEEVIKKTFERKKAKNKDPINLPLIKQESTVLIPEA